MDKVDKGYFGGIVRFIYEQSDCLWVKVNNNLKKLNDGWRVDKVIVDF